MKTLQVDLELIQKYNVPGPRYTSYPPANHFREAVLDGEFEERLRANNTSPKDLSLYFHLPFCQTLCWFCGCTTVITTQQGQSEVYLQYLMKEVDQMGRRLHPERKVVQLHFGGGTPTFFRPDELRQIGERLHNQFRFGTDVEAGVEIDPRRLSLDHLKALREIGFNRASIGVQDNNPEVQKAVHRIQPRALTEQTVAWIRETGFVSLNIDLIYGLPLQTAASFDQTLDEILQLQPDRLAIFNYAHVPWIKPAQRIFRPELMPSPEEKLQILKRTIETLTSQGYVYIGMDHFARIDDELAVAQRRGTLQRNFQGYSTRGGADIYAFGMSSISQAGDLYWQNHKDLKVYYGAIDRGELPISKTYFLTRDDFIRRETIMRLMCDLRLDYSVMSEKLEVDFADYFSSEIASLHDLEADGLVLTTATGLAVTELGRLLVRNIAMRFDVYLPKQTEKRYSKTI